jgi:hypothetical protein
LRRGAWARNPAAMLLGKTVLFGGRLRAKLANWRGVLYSRCGQRSSTVEIGRARRGEGRESRDKGRGRWEGRNREGSAGFIMLAADEHPLTCVKAAYVAEPAGRRPLGGIHLVELMGAQGHAPWEAAAVCGRRGLSEKTWDRDWQSATPPPEDMNCGILTSA